MARHDFPWRANFSQPARLNGRAVARDQVENEDRHGYHQQQMNGGAGNVKSKSGEPQYNQYIAMVLSMSFLQLE